MDPTFPNPPNLRQVQVADRQVDYREDPSCGGHDLSAARVGSYDNAIDDGSLLVKPYPDNSFKSYDLAVDALHSSGLHDPDRAAALKLVPPADAVGISAGGPSALSWERSGPDGSPPPEVTPW
ncbi:MAG TPA: hypothetical protein VKX16_10325 [Chloroflexota bacterium]|nr:hypothetical protein [Chloroflexota bacterium]